ncbi:outer membrane protein assembly factor BamE [Luteimonas gilva]|uniref:Outer membrane protein assembly factor BamE n=2 Tax=Luteimonas gilva TaxID=2572684 RepID=A0A4U5JJW3_9GAMM|nr:outer membrane protein assembly factor BamE [Luteimonas gilva]
MENTNKIVRGIPLALCAAVAMVAVLAGCTRHVSRDITPQGQAGEVVFPAVDRIVLKEGTFPTLEALRQIGPGVTRDQLYQLIGRPHFREGFHAREWDYLFHFRDGDQVVTCQYKVIFDGEYRGQNFHWLPAGCADRLKDRPVVASDPKRFEISGDALFAFGRSGLEDMLSGGRDELLKVANELKALDASVVQVVGHTDLIGSDAANLELSRRRAETVRDFLAKSGVSADGLSAHGVGEAEPVKQCDDKLDREALIACLQPNRRVEVVAKGFK